MSMINNKYKSTINSLLSLTDFERKKNTPNSKIFHLKRIKNALELLGNPQNTPKFTKNQPKMTQNQTNSSRNGSP